MTVWCKSCGGELNQQVRVCPTCGTKIHDVAFISASPACVPPPKLAKKGAYSRRISRFFYLALGVVALCYSISYLSNFSQQKTDLSKPNQTTQESVPANTIQPILVVDDGDESSDTQPGGFPLPAPEVTVNWCDADGNCHPETFHPMLIEDFLAHSSEFMGKKVAVYGKPVCYSSTRCLLFVAKVDGFVVLWNDLSEQDTNILLACKDKLLGNACGATVVGYVGFNPSGQLTIDARAIAWQQQ